MKDLHMRLSPAVYLKTHTQNILCLLIFAYAYPSFPAEYPYPKDIGTRERKYKNGCFGGRIPIAIWVWVSCWRLLEPPIGYPYQKLKIGIGIGLLLETA